MSRVQAERVMRKLYGIDFEDWARLYERQDGRCAGCLEPLGFDGDTHVDHCHETQRVRGLLCGGCNRSVGQAGDCPVTLLRLAAYLIPYATRT